MKKLFLTLLVVCLGIQLFSSTITYSVSNELPEITERGSYSEIAIENTFYPAQPGKPNLPVKAVTLLLPPGEKAVSVQINTGNTELINLSSLIAPGQTPQPISKKNSRITNEPDPLVYSLTTPYPQQLLYSYQTHYFKGHSILTVSVYPVQYTPSANELIYYSDIEILVTTESDNEASESYYNLYRHDNKTIRELESFVSNPEIIDRYPYQNTRNNENLLLIITENQYLDEMENFISFKTKQGYNPIIETVENIYGSQSGTDNQDKIRNCIKLYYLIYGIEYVMLAGDTETIPHRGFRVEAGETVDNDLPSDMYYSNLDRVGNGNGPDWNTNNNNYWGETNEADYYPEIGVGRISADTSVEFTAALNKQMMYQHEPVITDLEEALMVGEQLNDSPLTYGGDYKDQIVNGGTYDGFFTAGITNNFNVSTLYERDMYWSENNLFSEMNNGLNLLNHLGHSNTYYNMKLTNETVTNNNITANGINHNFFIIYTQGCYPGAFDNRDTYGGYGQDCIAEKFTTIQNGCVAFVGNTRYGWYMPGGTNSSSQYLDRQFFHAIFGNGITNISDANNYSKIQGIPQCSDDPWFRWSFYEVTLFGDPTLDIWTGEPNEIVANYPQSIPVTATSFECQTGIAGALVGVTLDNQHMFSGITDESGNIDITFSEPFTNVGQLEIMISRHNYLIHSGIVEVTPSNTPYIIIENIDILAGDNDVIEYGETVTLSLNLKNIGFQASESGTISISMLPVQYIDILENSADFTALAPQQTITLENAFVFSVANNTPNEFDFSFNVQISCGDYTWGPSINLQAFSPVMSTGEITIDDGDNNSLDPGETCSFNLPVINNGGAPLYNAVITISEDTPYFSLSDNSQDLDIIQTGEEISLTFPITVDAEAPIGYIGLFDLTITADHEQTFTEQFYLTVGITGDDFETGNFSLFPWESSGDANWSVTNNTPYEGIYCAKSGNIGSNETSSLSLTLNIVQSGNISFFKKVSCENDPDNNYDYLSFSIDGVEMTRWDGVLPWAEVSYPVSSGLHNFTWLYSKDPAVDSGEDCAWIDNIQFPPCVNGAALPEFFCDTQSLDFGSVNVGDSGTLPLTIFNFGQVPLTGSVSVPDQFFVASSRNTGREESREKMNTARNTVSYTIPSSGSVVFNVTFEPSATGEYSENLTINSNDPFNQIVLIGITAIAASTDAPENNNNEFTNELIGNFPNPFNPTTCIRFSLKERSDVLLNIFNLKGQLIKNYELAAAPEGINEIVWNGKDTADKNVSSGVFFYQIVTKNFQSVKKMVLLK